MSEDKEDNTTEIISELNKCQYLDVLEVGATNVWEFRILIAEALVSKDKTFEDRDEDLAEILKDTRLIEVTKESRVYDVRFNDYIGYSVLDESYTQWDHSEVFEGNLIRVYSKSRFLEYIEKGTFASNSYPGPFKHYEFLGLNHIISVASMSPPQIKRLEK